MLQEGGADWQAPPVHFAGHSNACYPGRRRPRPLFYLEARKLLGVARRARGAGFAPILSVKLVGLGPDTLRKPCPRRGRRAGVGAVEGVPDPGPSRLESPRGRGRGGSERAGGGLLGAGSAPSGAGLKGGKAPAGDWSHRRVHLN